RAQGELAPNTLHHGDPPDFLPPPIGRTAPTSLAQGISSLRCCALALGYLSLQPAFDLGCEVHHSRVLRIAGSCKLDRFYLNDASRPLRHDGDPIRKLDRLVDAVGDENHRLAFSLPNLEQLILHILSRLDI